MVYICEDCGHEEQFHATQNYTEWGQEDITIDSYGEIIDWGSREENDSEITDGPDNISCSACHSENIGEYDDNDVELFDLRGVFGIEHNEESSPQTGRELLEE